MSGLMSSLEMNVYLWTESLKTWSPLETAVIGGITVIVAVWVFKRLYRKLKKWSKKKERELKKLIEIIEKSESEEARRSARNDLLKRVGKTIFWSVLLIGWFVFVHLALSNRTAELHNELRRTYQEHLGHIDQLKDILKQKTIRKMAGTVCANGSIRDLEIARSERICLFEANRHWDDQESKDSAKQLKNTRAYYEVCMAKQGWLVRECQEDEKECVTLRTASGCCATRLKTDPENISIRCLETEAEETMILRWELICSWRAQIEGQYKAQNDMEKIVIMSQSYQACMLEQGWFTQQCTTSEQGCKEIPYAEGICTRRVREWLEHGGDGDDISSCVTREYGQ